MFRYMDENCAHPLRRRFSSILCFKIYREVKIMPNIKSAKKRVKVIKTKTLQNKMYRSALKTEIKKYDAAIASGDMAAAQAAYKTAVKKIDQAAAYGIIHKNAAARKKSQFTKKLNPLA
jgi:small subunit ribosomal protein S20